MKKIMSMVLGISLVFVAVIILNRNAHANGWPMLYAAKNIPVGHVEITNDETNIYVKYVIDDSGWCLSETHLDLGLTKEDLPNAGSKVKNLVPGQFSYGGTHDCVKEYPYVIPFEDAWEGENQVLVAAHAKVMKIEEYCKMVPTQETETNTVKIVSDTTDEYYNGEEWVYAQEAWEHPAWIAANLIPDATWVWTGEYVSNEEALNGAEYSFRKVFVLPDDSLNFVGNLDITTDNAYEIRINGNLVGSNGDWTNKESYDVSSYLQAGENTIEIFATNYSLAGGAPTSNPGGVLYSLEIDYDTPIYEEICEWMPIGEESAWGATAVGVERYNAKGNWATYIPYHMTSCSVYNIDVTSVNGNTNYSHEYVINYCPWEDEPSGEGSGSSGAETLSEIDLDLDDMIIAFKAVYTSGYTWYPKFELMEDNSLNFIDGYGSDNVNDADGTWNMN